MCSSCSGDSRNSDCLQPAAKRQKTGKRATEKEQPQSNYKSICKWLTQKSLQISKAYKRRELLRQGWAANPGPGPDDANEIADLLWQSEQLVAAYKEELKEKDKAQALQDANEIADLLRQSELLVAAYREELKEKDKAQAQQDANEIADLLQQSEQLVTAYKEELKEKDRQIKAIEQQLRAMQNPAVPSPANHEAAPAVILLPSWKHWIVIKFFFFYVWAMVVHLFLSQLSILGAWECGGIRYPACLYSLKPPEKSSQDCRIKFGILHVKITCYTCHILVPELAKAHMVFHCCLCSK